MLDNETSQSPKHVAQSIHLGVLSPKLMGAPQNSWVLLFNLQPSGVEKIFPSSWLEIDHDTQDVLAVHSVVDHQLLCT